MQNKKINFYIAKEIAYGKMTFNSAALKNGQNIQILSLLSLVKNKFVSHAEMKI
jgi:hypothetical protein